MLILAQRPTATACAGFRQWQAKGRQVRKGEKALKIFGYSTKKVTVENTETGEEEEKKVARFPILSVFDIDQTEPMEGAEDYSNPTTRLTGDDEAGITATVTSYLESLGWSVEREEIPGETNGYTTTDGSKRVAVDARLSPAQTAKTMIHEAAHVLMHADEDPAEYVAHRGTKETEAESVAYVVAGMLGLDTSAYSVGYVAHWRKKSDHGDALVLANILRTDRAAHRPLPHDSDLARAITVLARAQQDAVWSRQQMSNQVRSLLRNYYPAALEAFIGKQNGLIRPESRAVLAMAPTPARAAKLSVAQLQAALRRAGRVRGIAQEAARLKQIFRDNYAQHPQQIEEAMGLQLTALLLQLDAACRAADNLAEAVEEAFLQHADAQILLSFPGLGVQLGARILAEVGDDRARFADARAMKAYAGSAPVTRASGKKTYVGRRFIKNNRLIAAGFLWSFAALKSSEGANEHYRRRRTAGDWHAAAQRNLFNRFLGQLYHCLQTRNHFDEARAFMLTAPSSAQLSSTG